MPAARAFYESLGWTVTGPPADDHSVFVLGGATLFLWTAREAEGGFAAQMAALGHPRPSIVLAVNVSSRGEVDTAIAAVRAAGATIVTEPADKEWGGRSGHHCSPGGSAWEVAWAPRSAVHGDPSITWPEPPAA